MTIFWNAVILWRNRIPCMEPSIIDTFLGIFVIVQNVFGLVLDELVECLNGGIDTETAYEAKELRQCIRRFIIDTFLGIFVIVQNVFGNCIAVCAILVGGF